MPLCCNLVVKIISSEDALVSLVSSVMVNYVIWQLAVETFSHTSVFLDLM